MKKPSHGAFYGRLSQDRTGESLSIPAQRDLCSTRAAERGWTVVEEYVDPNISASRAKKRPGYERMLADIKLGLIDGIVCKNQDRLARNLTELAALVRLTREHNVAILLLDDEIDTSTADGRLKMHILGAVAENEADKLSERVKQQRDRAALAGTYTGGRRPFGYESDGVTVIESEAKHVRAMVLNYLDGMAINRIAIVLNHLVVQGKAPTPTRAKMWSATSVRSIIMNPRYAGLYTRKGKVSNVPAAWPAIISAEQHEQVIEKLGAPRTPKRGRKPVAMLSGVLVCSRCGGAMTSGVGSNGIKRYSCSKLPNNNGCGRMSVVAGYTEWWVSQMIFTALEGAALPAPPHAGDDVDRELADIEERLRQLALDYGNGSLDHDEWVTSRSALKARRDVLGTVQHAEGPPSILFDKRSVRERWSTLTSVEQRTIIKWLIKQIEVLPAEKGATKWTPLRLADPLWR